MGVALAEQFQQRITVNKKTRLFFVLISCLVVIYLSWPVSTLQVRTGSEGDVLNLVLPLAQGGKVVIGFVHSLYKVVQEESYLLVDGKLRLVEVFFGSFDALNYYDPFEVYQREAIRDGYKVSINPSLYLPVSFATGHSTDFWIKVGQTSLLRLDRITSQTDYFSLKMVTYPRLMARYMEIQYG